MKEEEIERLDYHGCGSGSCKLVRPTGQHNNGPCRCKAVIEELVLQSHVLQRRLAALEASKGDEG
jgi:hypothetical protein